MHPSIRGLVAAIAALGVLAVTAQSAEAGRKYRHNDGANFVAGLATGLIVGGIVAGSKPRGGIYYCYGSYCNGRYYGPRGYYGPKRYYGPRVYYPPRVYRPPPSGYYRPPPPRYYPPAPRYPASFSRAHYDYCFARYRSYRAYDNTFQPYHGPRKQCVSPYY